MQGDLNSLRIDRSMKDSAHGAAAPTGIRWARWATLVVLVGVVVTFGAIAMTRGDRAPEVAVIRVEAPAGASGAAGTGDVVLNATGYIVAAHKIQLAPKVVGRVAWIGVEMGDKVEKGQVLVRLEDDEYKARVLQASGQLNAAKARLEEAENGSRPEEVARAKADFDQALADVQNAEANLRRTRELFESKSTSAKELDDAEALFKSQRARADSYEQVYQLAKKGPRKEQIAALRAQVEQAQGVLALAEVDLSNTQIRAPLSGTILDRNVEVGEYVASTISGAGGAKGYVVSMADLSDLQVELDVSQNDFAKVAANQSCWVTTDAYPDRRYDGAVDLISPEANRQKATVQVKVKILRPDALLRPDMNATVSFRKPGAAGATTAASATTGEANTTVPMITIPATAVRDGAVFVVGGEGNVERRAVDVGATTSRGVQVRRGLTAGDTIVADPPADLKEGQAVRIQQEQQ
jgi:HlyD family secretion protein